MWIFADWGYLLPVITEDTDPLRKEALWDTYTNNGEFTFQVRARLESHLLHYIENYAKPGTYGEIWATPHHDYNYRLMTTKRAFAEAMTEAMMDIDYRNFKNQSLKFTDGKVYHDLLIDVWYDSCKLNPPGGIYGAYSDENPDGFGSVSAYDDSYWGGYSAPKRRIGDSFKNVLFEEEDDIDDTDWQAYKLHRTKEDMDKYNIPMSDWWEYTSRAEFEALVPELEKHFGNNTIKRMRKKNIKNVESWAAEGVVL